MKETNFLSTNGTDQVTVNVPTNTSPDYISMILSSLPSIFGLFGGGQQPPVQQPQQDFTPYYILGGAAIVFLLTSKK
jgi:hypothetical protein